MALQKIFDFLFDMDLINQDACLQTLSMLNQQLLLNKQQRKVNDELIEKAKNDPYLTKKEEEDLEAFCQEQEIDFNQELIDFLARANEKSLKNLTLLVTYIKTRDIGNTYSEKCPEEFATLKVITIDALHVKISTLLHDKHVPIGNFISDLTKLIKNKLADIFKETEDVKVKLSQPKLLSDLSKEVHALTEPVRVIAKLDTLIERLENTSIIWRIFEYIFDKYKGGLTNAKIAALREIKQDIEDSLKDKTNEIMTLKAAVASDLNKTSPQKTIDEVMRTSLDKSAHPSIKFKELLKKEHFGSGDNDLTGREVEELANSIKIKSR